MQPHSFSKRQLAATALMLEEEKNQKDMGSSATDQSNVTKIPTQAGNAHWSAVEIRDKFRQIFNSPSGFVPWQNKRVQC